MEAPRTMSSGFKVMYIVYALLNIKQTNPVKSIYKFQAQILYSFSRLSHFMRARLHISVSKHPQPYIWKTNKGQ